MPWIYRCWIDGSWHWKKPHTYTVVLRNNEGKEKHKYICDSCGESINERYQAGLDTLNMTPNTGAWDDENGEG
jgi:ribosomal protein L37AE/L43A